MTDKPRDPAIKDDDPDASLPVAGGLELGEHRFTDLKQLYAAMRKESDPRPGFGDRIVPGRGSEQADLFLLGEQPGDQEDREGQTFVGPAGRLLDRCVRDAAIDPTTIFLSNAVKRFKFRPRGKRRLHQTPNAGDIAHYRWWLGQEIGIVRPKMVVALGVTALQALIGVRRPLKAVRGRPYGWDGGMLLATVHPSYLLRLRPGGRDVGEEEAFVADLRRAAKAIP